MKVIRLTLGIALGTLFLLPASANAGYRVVKTVKLGGENGWDYLSVDAEARRLYVTHGETVVVLDLETDAVVGEIKDTAGVHGVALAPGLRRGFTSNGRAKTVTIFDLETLAVLGQVATGIKPDAIVFDSSSGRVFAFNGGSANVTAIDAATGTSAFTLALGGAPEFAVADGKGTVFVNLEDKAEVVAFDAKALKVTARWPLAPCTEPTGLAMDRASRRLFVGCSNELMAVLDADTGRVVTTLPIGRGVDGTAFDDETHLAFSSNGAGTVTVVREETKDRFSVVENVTTAPGARTMTLDPKTHRLYLTTADFGPPPPPTADRPHPRGPILPGSFRLLVLAP